MVYFKLLCSRFMNKNFIGVKISWLHSSLSFSSKYSPGLRLNLESWSNCFKFRESYHMVMDFPFFRKQSSPDSQPVFLHTVWQKDCTSLDRHLQASGDFLEHSSMEANAVIFLLKIFQLKIHIDHSLLSVFSLQLISEVR